MLNILRKNAQSFVIQVLIVIIAIVFVFWGFGTKLGDNPHTMAEVNGREIAYGTFHKAYELTVANYKQQFGDQLPHTFFEGGELKKKVLNQLIESDLLLQAAMASGLQISDREVQDRIKALAVFQSGGQFDLERYKAILAQNNLSPSAFETEIRNELLLNRITGLATSFAAVSDKEVQQWLEYDGQEIRIAFVGFDASALAPSEVKEEELKNWYAANKQRYKTQPERKLRYLFFSDANAPQSAAITGEMVRQYYLDHQEQYSTPEQRRARHILFRTGKEGDSKTAAGQKALAERILAEIKGGADFEQEARRYSEDASKDQGGDLGFFPRGVTAPSFEEALFSMQPGEISDLVQTPFGYHIIRLEAIRPAKTQTLEEAEGAIRKALEAQNARAASFQRASDAYEDIIKAGSLTKYGENGKTDIRETVFFTQDKPPQDGLPADPAFLQEAFKLRKGELSSIIETKDGYGILFVEDTREPSEPDLPVVRAQALSDFRHDKGLEMARNAAGQLLQKLHKGENWPAEVDRQESGYIRRGTVSGTVPGPVRQDAFRRLSAAGLPETPVEVDNTYYVYQILDVRQGKTTQEEEDLRPKIEQQLLAAEENKLMSAWLGLLQEKADIWVNQEMLR